MKDTCHPILLGYIGDVVAMERDIVTSVRTQLEDERVKAYPELKSLFLDLAVHGDHRAGVFEGLVADEGGSLGSALKESFAAVTGMISGLHAIARQHSLSHMVRDNTVAMNLASVNYGMLLTMALAFGHKRCEELAVSALNDCPEFVFRLTEFLPNVIIGEVSGDGTVPNTSAATRAGELIRESWNRRNPALLQPDG